MCTCEKENFVTNNYISNNNSDNNKNYINCAIITKLYKFNNKKLNKRKGNFGKGNFGKGNFKKSNDYENNFKDIKYNYEIIEKRMENAENNYNKNITINTDEGTYFGDIKNFQKHGFGMMHYPFDSEYKFYAGMWKDNIIEGYGDMVYRDGRIYSGIWKNNKLKGLGKIFYNDLEMCGTFKNNLLCGYGYIIKNKNIDYGLWNNNFFYINNLDSFLSKMYFIFH